METINELEQVHLDKFIFQVQTEIYQFSRKWKLENKKNPEMWPIEMSISEFYEQLIIHLTE